MHLVFAGTPEFAKIALRALIEAGHTIALVLTQPDRPAGRGLKLTPSPVKAAALEAGRRCCSRAACGWTASIPTRRPRRTRPCARHGPTR